MRGKRAVARKTNIVQRFLWWVAGADFDVLSSSNMPRWQGLKYSAIGSAICAIALLAFGGWFHQAALIFVGNQFWFPLSCAVALSMSAVMFFVERVLIISLHAGMARWQKAVAFSWRATIAFVNALILALPIALAYFSNAILLQLDNEKLSLMTIKRGEVSAIYGLPAISTSIDSLKTAMDNNRTQRAQLPADVQELLAQGKTCDAENKQLRGALLPRVSADKAERSQLGDYLANQSATDEAGVRQRIVQLTSLINARTIELNAKARDCARLTRQFDDGAKAYYAQRDQEYGDLMNQRNDKQNEMVTESRKAGFTIAKSDLAIDRNSTADLGARVRALVQLARSDSTARIILTVAMLFFWMIDMMAIISKLSNRATSPYEKTLVSQERKISAQIDADTFAVEARSAMKIDEVRAELEGVRRFCAEGEGLVFVARARERAQLNTEMERILAPMQEVHAVMREFEEAQNRLDELELRFRGRRDVAENIEEIRDLLRERMRKTTQVMGVDPFASAAE
jgi:hypothetical protein